MWLCGLSAFGTEAALSVYEKRKRFVIIQRDAEKELKTPNCNCSAALHMEVSRATSYTSVCWAA